MITLLREGLAACSGERLVEAALLDPALRALLTPAPGGRRVVFALGKVAAPMARGAVAFGVDRGIVAGPLDGPIPQRCTHLPGEHPVPGEGSLAAGEALLAAAAGLRPADVALLLVSGGGSALAEALAPGVTLPELQSFTTTLLGAGLPIASINAARRRLSRLKDGGLARALGTRRAMALVLSDVEGAALSVVASGPGLPGDGAPLDPALVALAPASLRDALVRRPEGRVEAVIPHRLLASPATLTSAIARAAARQRLAPIVWPIHEVAPIGEVAARLSDYVRALARGGERRLLIVGGEPIVTLPPGHGRGGRMQQLALLLSLALEGVKFRGLAAGSDGCEAGGTLAGAMFDGGTAAALRAKGLDAAAALRRSDATPLWEALGAGLPAGPTGTNLADVVLLQAPWEPASLRGP